MRLRSRTLRGTMPKVDAQYHIGVHPLDDLDRPQPRVVAPHANPGDRFYNPDPIARSNPGSRGSSTEPMNTDEAQQTTNRLAQTIRDSSHLRRSGSLGRIPSAPFHLPVAGAATSAAAAAAASHLGATSSGALTGTTDPETQERSAITSGEMIKASGGTT